MNTNLITSDLEIIFTIFKNGHLGNFEQSSIVETLLSNYSTNQYIIKNTNSINGVLCGRNIAKLKKLGFKINTIRNHVSRKGLFFIHIY